MGEQVLRCACCFADFGDAQNVVGENALGEGMPALCSECGEWSVASTDPERGLLLRSPTDGERLQLATDPNCVYVRYMVYARILIRMGRLEDAGHDVVNVEP